jgi:hypothetical protein
LISGRGGEKYLLFLSFETGSGVHPVVTRVIFLGGGREAAGVVKLIIYLLVSRSRMVELYLQSPIHLIGVVFD